MKAITHLSFALFTSIGLGTVQAQPPGRPGDRDRPGLPVDRLMRLDQNEDGKLSADEVEETRVRAMIERADQDNDGLVTREELEAFVPDRSAEGRSGDREARPREDRPREARPHDDRPEARGDRPERRNSRRDAPRAERRSGEDRDFAKGPRGRRGPQHQRPDDRGFGRPDHGSHRPHGKMDPGRREGDRAHSHGPQSHGPQDHGPQNRGPKHREPRAAGGPPAAGQVLPEFVQDRMDLNEEQRDALRKLQATVDSELKEILTEDQLQSMTQGPRNRPQPPEGAERGPRRGPPREFDRDDSRHENRRERPESVDA
ncbi:EF-hand domain-containing protein [Rhodopirellula sp. JC740]|uniref:EF-hand domain-containing protein n=1 Tax=Rhodopirellula halodulae TaxID=2894198 RepID=A0ABS8NGY7_9BACT|nr:EF-hand domain-containing protein [Rhodopirellula sp. JC740]MCC9642822.1 EF-hand domain-containing protein [Rhodopirellula sp. JC740]